MSINDFEYLCFDLDGTLLDSNKKITLNSVRKIRELSSLGVGIILASGRHFDEILPYVKELGLKNKDYVIACDGLYVYSASGELLDKGNCLSMEDVKKVDAQLQCDGLSLITNEKDYFLTKSFRYHLSYFVRIVLGKRGNRRVSFGTRFLPKDLQIEKIQLCADNGKSVGFLSKHYTVHETITDGRRIEVLDRTANKYEALLKMCSQGIISNIDKVLFFGNDNNDRECFINMKHTVAMADTPEDLRNKAFYATLSSDEDGVYRALCELIVL